MYLIDNVIILVDIDCFYCQVEEKLNPHLQNKPVAVVQYNTWREGGIIAANYLAREKGVRKGLWCYEAKEKCPEIMFATVSQVRGRADLTKYRDAGKEVADVLQTFTSMLERASVDEAYLDITAEVNKRLRDCIEPISIEKLKNTHIVGSKIEDFLENINNSGEFSEGSYRLAMGGVIAEEIRAEVFNKTGYKVSAGIAHNKILAKLACGLHKPNAQTILPQESVIDFFRDLPLEKVRNLGGKFGKSISEELQISNMGQLLKFTEKELINTFEEKTGKWLYNIARGIDLEPVKTRLIPKSISCCKRFPGKNCLVSSESVERWVNELATEISERLEKDMEENNRRAKQLVVSFAQSIGDKNVSSSRTHPLNSNDKSKISQDSLFIIKKYCSKSDGTYNNIIYLGMSAGNFQNIHNNSDIKHFFKNSNAKDDQVFVNKSSNESIRSGLANETNNSDSEMRGSTSCVFEETVFSKNDCKMSNNDDSHTLVNELKSDHNTLCINILEPHTSAKNSVNSSVETKSSSFFNEYFNSHRCENLGSLSKNEEESPHETFSKTASSINLKNEAISDTENNICSDYMLPANSTIPNECSNSLAIPLHNEHIFNAQSSTSCSDNNINKTNDDAGETSSDSRKKMKLTNNNTQKRIDSKTEMESGERNSVKRKVGQINPILTYLRKKEDLNDENSEFCAECRKRIKLEDFEFHTDYHIALRLHNEINTPAKKLIKPSKRTKHNDIKTKNNGNILYFFNK